MKEQNRKKLASIANRVLREQWSQAAQAAKGKGDNDYAEALGILSEALQEIEERFGIDLA